MPGKRVYVLVALGTLALLIGAGLIRNASEPLSTSEDVLITSGGYHHIEFGILGTGQLSVNFSERQGRSVEFFVFDERGYSSFLGRSDFVPPLAMQEGANVTFSVDLAGTGQYHLVFGDFRGREELQVHLDLLVIGLKTSGILRGAVILVGGFALFAALQFSRASPRRVAPVPPSPVVPSPSRSSSPQNTTPEPSDDDTRLY